MRQITEHDYDTFRMDRFPIKRLLRGSGSWTVWYASDGNPCLVLEDAKHCRVIVVRYFAVVEMLEDVQMVIRLFKDRGEGAAGTPAFLKPPQPFRPAAAAKDFPPTDFDPLA